MSETIYISPQGPVGGAIRPPGSKSITNRALVCAALADGPSQLIGALDSDDTRVMIRSLKQLGGEACIQQVGANLHVHGQGGVLPATSANLFVSNSGTTVRFLTAMVTLGHGEFRLDGVARMRERPIGDLLTALNELGAIAISELENGCPPVVVKAEGLKGGRSTIRGDISSQFLSALLMAAPYASQDVELVIQGELVSRPYVRMTTAVMKSFGVEVMTVGENCFRIRSGSRYQGIHYEIEPDASAASYFWGAAAITQGQVTVLGLSPDALQGDVAFCSCLERMGCRVESNSQGITVFGGPLKGIDVNMNAISDTVQTLAAVALFAEGPTTITGVAHIRHKETDRIGDLAQELRKLGAKIDELPDGLRVTPGPLKSASINTYNDHRMAMSLALVGLAVPGVAILDPRCVDKTYPQYFEDLASIRAP